MTLEDEARDAEEMDFAVAEVERRSMVTKGNRDLRLLK
jgi:hypothetical protein